MEQWLARDFTRDLSPTAVVQAERAARKIIKAFDREGYPAWEDGDCSEVLLEWSYDEAMERDVYQSEDFADQLSDWRSHVEQIVVRHFVEQEQAA